MKCPYCLFTESRVLDTRTAENNTKIRRRRECLKCLRRFTTNEVIELIHIMVVKRDCSRQPFDRQKLINGIIRACEKRPVSYEKIESIAEEIEAEIINTYGKEVSSQHIGECTMKYLRNVDEVAYVRFASVYKQFENISTFIEEINSLKSDK